MPSEPHPLHPSHVQTTAQRLTDKDIESLARFLEVYRAAKNAVTPKSPGVTMISKQGYLEFVTDFSLGVRLSLIIGSDR